MMMCTVPSDRGRIEDSWDRANRGWVDITAGPAPQASAQHHVPQRHMRAKFWANPYR